MVAALVVPGDATSLRRDVRSLVLPGQRRIHFTKEQPERKRLILSRLTAFGAQAQVFHCATKSQLLGREACLTGIVAHAAEHAHWAVMLLLLSSGSFEGLTGGEPVPVFVEESGVPDVAAFDA